MPFLCLFVLSKPSKLWEDAAHIGEGGSSLLSILIQMLIYSGNTLTDTPREDCTRQEYQEMGNKTLSEGVCHTRKCYLADQMRSVHTTRGKVHDTFAKQKQKEKKAIHGIIYVGRRGKHIQDLNF